MTLAGLLRGHRGPLTADFHRYYGLSLSRMSEWGIPLREVADMAAHLPPDSATARSVNPDWQRTLDVDLLRMVEHGVRVLAWQKTKDGSKGTNPPEPIPLPWDPEPEGVIKGDAMEWDEAAAFLGWEAEMARFFD